MNIAKSLLVLIVVCFTVVSRSEIKTTLEADSLSFLSPDYENTDKKSFGFVGATLKSDVNKPDPFMLNLTGVYAVGESVLSYLNIREIYFSYQIDPNSTIHVGRKLFHWSSLDEDWNLGFFQPQFRWNPISPENQGMTGIFWEKNESLWGLTLFASPIYIPDQGPGYELKDGQFERSNPWFSNPPQNIRFQGQVYPIDYDIRRPETSDVVFQPVYAANFILGEKTGFFSNISGAYKPAHQLALAYKTILVTTRVRVDVTPKTYLENIYAADMGYRDDWGLLQFSVLYTKPQSPAFEAGYNVPIIEESLSFGPKFVYKFRPFSLGLSYLDTVGGSVKETGPDVEADRASLTQRFLFRQALQLNVTYKDILFKKLLLESSAQYRQSTKDEFTEIRFRNRFDVRGPWSFWVDVILIETADKTVSNLGPFRNLDQVWIGAGYDI